MHHRKNRFLETIQIIFFIKPVYIIHLRSLQLVPHKNAEKKELASLANFE